MTTEQPPKKRRGPKPAGGKNQRFSGPKRGDGPSHGGGERKGKFAQGKPGHKGRHQGGRGGKPPAHDRDRSGQDAPADSFNLEKGERIAKVMARAGLCSRREAEAWIEAGRVEVNGKQLETPAVTVTGADTVKVDGNPLPMRERTRLWLYYKPRGLVTTNKDPEGRPTVFQRLPNDLPRVLTVGRLDINTEGLLLLTNDGGLARVLELPATGWLRRYRVRAFGKVTQAQLDALADGVAIDGVLYGAIEATLDKEQGDNVWLTVGLREGKNREVKRVLEHIGLAVNRLIRLSFGPFQLMDLPEGGVREIRGRVLRDQLGEKLAEEAGADFDAPIFHQAKPEEEKGGRGRARKDERGDKASKGSWMTAREGQAAKSGKKGGFRDRPAESGGQEWSSSPQKRRSNAGERQVKVSPRSRFRMTSEPRPQARFEERERPEARPRRIWGEEGLVEDKQQESRAGRPKGDGRRGDRDGGGRGENRGQRRWEDSGEGRGRDERSRGDRGRGPRGGGDR